MRHSFQLPDVQHLARIQRALLLLVQEQTAGVGKQLGEE